MRDTVYSDGTEDNEIERISALEGDLKHIQTFNNNDVSRSASMQTADLTENDHTYDNISHRAESLVSDSRSATSNGGKSERSELVVKPVELSKTKLKHRIFAQFIAENEQAPAPKKTALQYS